MAGTLSSALPGTAGRSVQSFCCELLQTWKGSLVPWLKGEELLQEKRGQCHHCRCPGAGRYSPLMSAARWGHNEVAPATLSRDVRRPG